MDKDLYISKCKSFYKFMIIQNQWSGLTMDDVEKWLSNFSGYDIEEQYLVHKLLSKLIYFSEKDMVKALRSGLFSCLGYDDILLNQKDSCFNLSNKAMENIYNTNKNRSVFIPLLDSDKPHESGPSISRLLVQQELIEPEKSMFLKDIAKYYNDNKFQNIIILDDCIGSGDQIRNFYRNSFINVDNNEIHLSEFCNKNNIHLFYLVLFGSEKSVEELKEELTELNIHCVRLLSDQQRVFSDTSYIWANETKEKAYEFFDRVTNEAQIGLLGYNDLDFAFIMHNTIPDWSLPIFWKSNSNWNYLMRRKNSNV